jgi:hypothetical protein
MIIFILVVFTVKAFKLAHGHTVGRHTTTTHGIAPDHLATTNVNSRWTVGNIGTVVGNAIGNGSIDCRTTTFAANAASSDTGATRTNHAARISICFSKDGIFHGQFRFNDTGDSSLLPFNMNYERPLAEFCFCQ